MNAKTYIKPATPMSYGPSIEDLRVSIDRAEAEGIARADMVLRLNFRDASLIKRSPSVGVDEVSFEGGEMRFLGVRIVVGQVGLSSLQAPAEPDPLPPEPPAKKTKAKSTKPKAPTKKALAAAAALAAAEATADAEEEAEMAAEEPAEV